MKRTIFSLALLFSACLTQAAASEIFRADATGHLVINPQGQVTSVVFNQDFGDELNAVLKSRVGAWHFAPVEVDGKAVNAKAHFSLDLQADFGDASKGELRITDAQFVDPPEQRQSKLSLTPPRYPAAMLRGRYGAEVVLIVEIDETGKVVQTSGQDGWIFADKLRGDSKAATRAMEAFTEAAATAVEQWQLSEAAARGKRFVRVPITFSLESRSPWHRAHFVPMAREPWTAEVDAAKITQLEPDGSAPKAEFRLLDALDPAFAPAG